MKALKEIVGQVLNLLPDMPLPMSMTAFNAWLMDHVDHPMKAVPVTELKHPWKRWMVRHNLPLMEAAGWYARQQTQIVRKVAPSGHTDPDVDFVAFTVEYAVTRNTTMSGHGLEAVYVYGFANDPDYLKIGMASGASTVHGAYRRVMQQVGTSNRQLPVLYHVFFTDNSRRLEAKLHRHFKNLGRWTYEGAGTEWFRVSLGEVMEVGTS